MKRNKFSLSYTHLLSCDMGELIPCGLVEVLPGDSIQMQTSALIRCAPMLAPPMHPVRVRIHHWYVPHRLVWTNFENFITGGPDGLNASVPPFANGQNIVQGTLRNYIGLPVANLTSAVQYSMIPFRGYVKIFNEWYRDEDLVTAVAMATTDGVDGTTDVTLQKVAWEKDYFTSARPWEQKGAQVTIPIGTSAPVVFAETGATPGTRTLDRAGTPIESNVRVNEAGTAGAPIVATADLTGASTITVNALRESLAIQRFEEARAMYGSRYPEYLRAIGVRSSDARLNRPEYLGGGMQTVQFSEVVQSAADGANPVSTLRGHGISAMRSNRFRRFIEEHGYIFTMFSVLPKTIYLNGLQRHMCRETKYDYWQRELEHLGQQPIQNREIYALHSTPEGTFGYQDRYDEYRSQWSRVSGEFATSTLDYWHFARSFAAEPALNSTFVTSVPSERPFAAPTADVLYCQFHHSIQARRLLSRKATPRTF